MKNNILLLHIHNIPKIQTKETNKFNLMNCNLHENDSQIEILIKFEMMVKKAFRVLFGWVFF